MELSIRETSRGLQRANDFQNKTLVCRHCIKVDSGLDLYLLYSGFSATG